MFFDFKADRNGFVQVFVANESDANVWFDDMEIEIIENIIIQENHYYPFGMNLIGIEKEAEAQNRFQYNSQTELENNFDLSFYETPFRSYDPQLGIFRQVEPLADIYVGISTYQYAYNNPISLNDPTGLSTQPNVAKGLAGLFTNFLGGLLSQDFENSFSKSDDWYKPLFGGPTVWLDHSGQLPGFLNLGSDPRGPTTIVLN